MPIDHLLLHLFYLPAPMPCISMPFYLRARLSLPPLQSVVMQFKLVRGRYERDHARLEVYKTGRVLYNTFLEEMYRIDSSHLSDGEDR